MVKIQIIYYCYHFYKGIRYLVGLLRHERELAVEEVVHLDVSVGDVEVQVEVADLQDLHEEVDKMYKIKKKK